MTNPQFIAHAAEPRTFSDKKGATKAVKRDLGKHFDVHGDILFDTGFDVKPAGDRFGVVVYVDLTPDEATKKVGPELSGYVIEPQLKAEPKPKAAPVEKKQAGKRKTGEINVAPMDKLIAARAGSKQQAIIDMLAKDCVWDETKTFFPKGEHHVGVVGRVSKVGGCTLEDLRTICVKKETGEAWDDNSIRSGLYFDVKQKGYGVTTRIVDNVAYYMLALPEAYTAPMPARTPKT